MKNLFFWAQSLDNQAPDLIFKDREELTDDFIRRQIVAEIYEVPGEKIKLTSGNSESSEVTIRFTDPKFVIEAVPLEKDEANRLAPVVIYGELPEELSSDWVEGSCTKIREVLAHKLNRNLNADTVTTIKEWFTSALEEKKKKAEVQEQLIDFGTVFVIPLIVVSVLQYKGIQLDPLQIGVLMTANNYLVRTLPKLLNGRKIITR